jgi:tetratricopeptide (TPR) repeat protein
MTARVLRDMRRGLAYSEKARYCRFAKLISAEEYERMFGLAVQGGERATVVDPASAEAWFKLGQIRFSRIGPEHTPDSGAWLAAAAADFTRAVERDPRHYLAWDMLGLVRQASGNLDKAIEAYTRAAALNSHGKGRLAEAYCQRGGAGHKEKNYEAAIADYRKSIELGASPDACDCDPYNPLAGAYHTIGDYDKAWQIVGQARRQKRWIMPEILEALKRDSGRDR